MQKYTKFFNNIAELLETGLVSSKDLKEELENSLKFTAEKIINKLKLVSREEFEVQKALIKKLEKKIDKVKYNRGYKKKFKKVKKL
jgi:BMFP domain-containing protein YqiC